MNHAHQITLNRDHQILKCARFLALGSGALALTTLIPEPLAFFAGALAINETGKALYHGYFAYKNNQIKQELQHVDSDVEKQKLLEISSAMNENQAIAKVSEAIKQLRLIQVENRSDLNKKSII